MLSADYADCADSFLDRGQHIAASGGKAFCRARMLINVRQLTRLRECRHRGETHSYRDNDHKPTYQ
jgi:hypothetical protein